MKINDVLNEKIRRGVIEKYADKRKTLQAELDAIKEKEIAELEKRIIKLQEIDDELLQSIVTATYSRNMMTTADMAKNFYSKIPQSKENAEAYARIHALNNTQSDEITDLQLVISYSKDLEDIKKAFADTGLKF